MIFPHDLIARIEALEAHAKCEGQQMCDGAEAERRDYPKGNDMKTDSTLTDEQILAALCEREIPAATLDSHISGRAGELVKVIRTVCASLAPQGAATPPAPADETRALQEIHNWLVCWSIASPEDMAQSFEHMEGVAGRALGYVPEGVSDAEWFGEATPPAIREPEPTVRVTIAGLAMASGRKMLWLMEAAASAGDGTPTANQSLTTDQVLQVAAALATPAPAPSIPTEQVLALLEAGGFIKAGKLELARAIIASAHPAGLASGAVEQGMPPRGGA